MSRPCITCWISSRRCFANLAGVLLVFYTIGDLRIAQRG
jgi:hypothetical protein